MLIALKKNSDIFFLELISVIQAGSYCLFETDSEDEEEEGDTEQREEEESKRKTAFQVSGLFLKIFNCMA